MKYRDAIKILKKEAEKNPNRSVSEAIRMFEELLRKHNELLSHSKVYMQDINRAKLYAQERALKRACEIVASALELQTYVINEEGIERIRKRVYTAGDIYLLIVDTDGGLYENI